MRPSKSTDSPIKKKLHRVIKNRYPSIQEKELSLVIHDLKRFVVVAHRILTEPQASIKYRDKKVRGKTIKERIISTDYNEFKKVIDKTPMPLNKAFKKFSRTLDENAKRK